MQQKIKRAIRQITISHPRNLVGSQRFHSFQDADDYLGHLLSVLTDDMVFHVHFFWDGGVEYVDTMLLPSNDSKGKRYVEDFLQNTILHNLLIPSEAETYEEMCESVNQPSYQMERMTIPEDSIDYWQFILTDCQGFDDAKLLNLCQMFGDAVRESDNSRPFLIRVRERGRKTFKRLQESSTTWFFRDHAMAKLKEKYAELFESVYEDSPDRFFVKNEHVMQFENSLFEEELGLDERFSSFGGNLYHLFPSDIFFLNANIGKLRTLDNQTAKDYFSRLDAISGIFPTLIAEPRNYASAYAKAYQEAFSQPSALQSRRNVTVAAIRELAGRGENSGNILTEFRSCDPFVPFFEDGVYESMVFGTAENAHLIPALA